VRLTRTLIVEASGVVKADVAVKDAVISGVVVGNVTASDSVQITSEGRMVGDISAPRVIIVDGASFRGRVDMGDVDATRHEGAGAKSESRPGLARPAGRSVSPPVRSAQPARSSSKETARPTTPPRPPASSSAPLPPLVAGAKKRVILKKGKR